MKAGALLKLRCEHRLDVDELHRLLGGQLVELLRLPLDKPLKLLHACAHHTLLCGGHV